MAHKAAEIRGTELNLDFTALKRPGQPADIAGLVEFLLGDSSKFMTSLLASFRDDMPNGVSEGGSCSQLPFGRFNNDALYLDNLSYSTRELILKVLSVPCLR